MIAQEKKELILRKLENGDKRSYNEIAADLELQLWTEFHGGSTSSSGIAPKGLRMPNKIWSNRKARMKMQKRSRAAHY